MASKQLFRAASAGLVALTLAFSSCKKEEMIEPSAYTADYTVSATTVNMGDSVTLTAADAGAGAYYTWSVMGTTGQTLSGRMVRFRVLSGKPLTVALTVNVGEKKYSIAKTSAITVANVKPIVTSLSISSSAWGDGIYYAGSIINPEKTIVYLKFQYLVDSTGLFVNQQGEFSGADSVVIFNQNANLTSFYGNSSFRFSTPKLYIKAYVCGRNNNGQYFQESFGTYRLPTNYNYNVTGYEPVVDGEYLFFKSINGSNILTNTNATQQVYLLRIADDRNFTENYREVQIPANGKFHKSVFQSQKYWQLYARYPSGSWAYQSGISSAFSQVYTFFDQARPLYKIFCDFETTPLPLPIGGDWVVSTAQPYAGSKSLYVKINTQGTQSSVFTITPTRDCRMGMKLKIKGNSGQYFDEVLVKTSSLEYRLYHAGNYSNWDDTYSVYLYKNKTYNIVLQYKRYSPTSTSNDIYASIDNISIEEL